MSNADGVKNPLGHCKELLTEYGAQITTIAQDALDQGYEPEELLIFCVVTEARPWLGAMQKLHETHDTQEYGQGDSVYLGAISVDVAIKVLGPLMLSVAEILAKKEKNDCLRILFVRGTSVGLGMQMLVRDDRKDMSN